MNADDVYEILQDFIKNDFAHLRKKVDWIFVFMLSSAVGLIGTLIATIIALIRITKIL